MIEFKQKTTKYKILSLFSLVIVFFGLTLLPELNNEVISAPSEDQYVDDIQPKTSAAQKADITKIELIQGGKAVEWTLSNQGQFNCGAGPFSMRLYMPEITSRWELWGIIPVWVPYRLKVSFSAFYPNFDVLINIKPFDDFYNANPDFVSGVLALLGLQEIELPIVFERTSQNYVDVTDAPYYDNDGTDNDYYEVSPEGLLQWDAYAFLLHLIRLFPESDYKNIQSIEYDLINYIDIKVQRFWMDSPDRVSYKGGAYMDELHMEIKNEDVTGPQVNETVSSQEDKNSNVEIVCDLADEEFGSGVENATLYYSIDRGSYLPSNMLLLDDGLYHGSIPPPPLGSQVTYYIASEDRAGNVATSITYVYDAEPATVPPVIILLLGILGVVAASVVGTVMYRRKNRPAIITLPQKNKVEKYYKKISKEEGTIGKKKGDKFTKNNMGGS